MDDMKKLVEKYKRELMEYSKTAPVPEKLSFPEMLPEEEPPAPEPQTSSAPLTEEAGREAPKAPQIIGYSDDQRALDSLSSLSSLEKYLADLGQTEEKEPESEPLVVEDDFNTLPPQFIGDVPQNDFTGNAVSPENNTITGETEPEPPVEFPPEGELTSGQPGEAENIGNIPESGQSPDEQLGRRSFESQQQPVNSPEDVKPLVQTQHEGIKTYPPEPEYSTLDEFLKINPRQGTLRFRTYTARNALPVPGAAISVTKVIGGKRHIFYQLTTDSSGQTEIVTLPAPSSVYSQTATSGVQPYSLYDADINAPGYAPVSVRDLPIFEGILSVQRAALVPLAGNDRREIITETEPDLTEVSDA